MAKVVRVVNRDQCIGCLSCMTACSRVWEKALTTQKARLRVKPYPDAEGAFSIRICLACKDPDCAKACPTGALKPKEGGGVLFDPEKCTHCGECVNACVQRALQWDDEKQIPLICYHCGVCVQFCPNDVLEFTEVPE
jgi:Fe-S-cluster-containing dehydrogenase component